MRFINVGFGNMVAANRVITLVTPDSAPIKRLIQDAREKDRVIDVSCGRRTRSVIITDSENIILSAIHPETISNRLNNIEETANESNETVESETENAEKGSFEDEVEVIEDEDDESDDR